MNLHNCKRLDIRNSSIDGFGVFASDDIKAGEILEEVPFVLFPRHTGLSKNIYDLLNNSGFLSQKEKHAENLRMNLKFKDPEKYYFKWFPPVQLDGDPIVYTVLPLGNGPIYNTSNTRNNAGWSVGEKTFTFKAEIDILKDEEIKTFYGYFVTEVGGIFNCEMVFNLAIDNLNGRAKCYLPRFSSVEQFEQAKLNASYVRLSQLVGNSKDGLNINKIGALLPNLEEKAAFDFPDNASLSLIYGKINEYRQSNFPLIKMYFSYEDKNSSVLVNEQIIFKK